MAPCRLAIPKRTFSWLTPLQLHGIPLQRVSNSFPLVVRKNFSDVVKFAAECIRVELCHSVCPSQVTCGPAAVTYKVFISLRQTVSVGRHRGKNLSASMLLFIALQISLKWRGGLALTTKGILLPCDYLAAHSSLGSANLMKRIRIHCRPQTSWR